MKTGQEDRRPVLAVDLGGTKFAAALVDCSGRVLGAQRVLTPRGDGADAEVLFSNVARLLENVLSRVAQSEVRGIGIASVGPMTWPQGVLSPVNIPGWRDFPLRDRLVEAFPGLPVRIHNDSVCLVIGEHWRGAGRGRSNLLGMVVSTGVGGGLILGDRLIDGAGGNAGHIGHVIVEPDGPLCGCGGSGCLEALASGPAICRWAHGEGWRPDTLADDPDAARLLAADAARGQPVALAAMRRAAEAIGIAVASAAQLLDLEVVIVGGGLAQAGPILFSPLEDSFRRHARLGFARKVHVVPAALGQDAGLVGAAALYFEEATYWHPGPDR